MASVLLASWFCVARQNIVRFSDVFERVSGTNIGGESCRKSLRKVFTQYAT